MNRARISAKDHKNGSLALKPSSEFGAFTSSMSFFRIKADIPVGQFIPRQSAVK